VNKWVERFGEQELPCVSMAKAKPIFLDEIQKEQRAHRLLRQRYPRIPFDAENPGIRPAAGNAKGMAVRKLD
jgi:hypothetical protein